MANTLIIDGNSIGYASQSAMKLHSGGMQTQAAFGFIKSMRELCVVYPEFTPMVLWDSKAQWRYDLHPEYKSNRDSDPKKVAERDAYAAMRPYIARAMNSLGVRQMTVKGYEADDMAGYLVRKLSADPKNNIGLISGDRDWLQLVRSNVFWRDIREDDRLITGNNFYDKTGCRTPFAFLESKILQGDTSDVISGVGGIGEKGAPEFIAEFGSVREFWRRCDSGEFAPKLAAHIRLWKGTSPFTREEWAEQQVLTAVCRTEKEDAKLKKQWMDAWTGQGRSIYKRNFQLMQLLKVDAPKKEDVSLDLGKFDLDAFADICGELSFMSITKNIETFTNPFKR